MALPPIITLKNPLATASMMFDMGRDLLGAINKKFDEYGDIFMVEGRGEKQVLLRHPDHLREVLVEKADIFAKDASYTDPKLGLKRFLGDGLITSNGDFWKRQRRLIAPALHAKRIAAYADQMSASTERRLDSWHDGAELDIDNEMMRLTLEIVTGALFNVDVRGDARRIGDAMSTLQFVSNDGNNLWSLVPEWMSAHRRRREGEAVDVLDEIVYRVIAERRAQGEITDTGDLLSMLLLAEDDDGTRMTDAQIRDELMTMFLAGHETTANTMNWTWILLAQHPQVEAKLHEEVDHVLNGRAPTLDDLRQLPYTDQVIKEVMRLYPVAYAISRIALEDTTIGGYDIPKGTTVVLATFAAHRDPRWFENPNAFLPERWTPEADAARPKYAYTPFGGGPRVCVGNAFALMEAQTILAMTASRYRLRLLSDRTIKPDTLITLRPKGGLHMRVERRKQPVFKNEMITTPVREPMPVF